MKYLLISTLVCIGIFFTRDVFLSQRSTQRGVDMIESANSGVPIRKRSRYPNPGRSYWGCYPDPFVFVVSFALSRLPPQSRSLSSVASHHCVCATGNGSDRYALTGTSHPRGVQSICDVLCIFESVPTVALPLVRHASPLLVRSLEWLWSLCIICKKPLLSLPFPFLSPPCPRNHSRVPLELTRSGTLPLVADLEAQGPVFGRL